MHCLYTILNKASLIGKVMFKYFFLIDFIELYIFSCMWLMLPYCIAMQLQLSCYVLLHSRYMFLCIHTNYILNIYTFISAKLWQSLLCRYE